MPWSPYQAGSDARAWAGALRQAEISHYGLLRRWERWLLWYVLRTPRLRRTLQLGFEADVLRRFADIQDGHLDVEGTPTPREVKW